MSRMGPYENFVLDASCVRTIARALMPRPTAGSVISDTYRAWVSTQTDPAKAELRKKNLDICALLRMVEPDEAQGLHCRLDDYNHEVRTYLQAVVNEAKKNRHVISANANVVSSTQASPINDAYVRSLEQENFVFYCFFMLLFCLFLYNTLSPAAADGPLRQDQPAILSSENIDQESLMAIKIEEEEEEVVQMLTFGPYARQVIKVED
ncbi:hypothetical protein C0992_000479 [Termitomyces sp. T32_za158]|nr:hypothetical protein C0992_000479 [Termitomyces sp. T32_za158]